MTTGNNIITSIFLYFVVKEIVTAININASAAPVWQVLTDFENYPAWDPFIKKITGKPAKDAKLEVHICPIHTAVQLSYNTYSTSC